MNPEILTGHTCSEGDGCSPEHPDGEAVAEHKESN